MTIYDNMKMFDLAVECGAAINILNKQQLNPLTMAAFLAKKAQYINFRTVSSQRLLSALHTVKSQVLTPITKGGFFLESAMKLFQISKSKKKYIPKNNPELEI